MEAFHESLPEDWVFKGTNTQRPDALERLPDPPPWRSFNAEARLARGEHYQARIEEIEMVNAALFLRRPLLITGKPGTGKTSLAYAVAYELNLGQVLSWPITTRATLQQGLYQYDAIARLQDASLRQGGTEGRANGTSEIRESASPQDVTSDSAAELGNAGIPSIGKYIRLGPLGTALLPRDRPRVLLIDEIDKSDIDLPNDLLHVFEEGGFEIPELSRLPETPVFETVEVLSYDSQETVEITRGHVRCRAFPLVILTSNGEREFPPAFLRRCLRLEIPEPTPAQLAAIVEARLGMLIREKMYDAGADEKESVREAVDAIIEVFRLERDDRQKALATDQLLNAVYLTIQDVALLDREQVRNAVLRALSDTHV